MNLKNLILLFSILAISSCSNLNKNIWDNQKINNSNSWIVSQSWNNNKIEKKEPKPISSETQEIIKLQMKNWPNYIIKLDCNKYSNYIEAKKYCESQKKIYEEKSSEITWEKVLKKWDDYIKTFDCKTIKSTYWQKYCIKYKDKIKKWEELTKTQSWVQNWVQSIQNNLFNQMDNKEFQDFLKLSKEKILNYDCAKFIEIDNKNTNSKTNTWVIWNNINSIMQDYFKACWYKKISTLFQWLNEDEILKIDCNSKHYNSEELNICNNSKIWNYIELLKSKNIKTINCDKIFTDKAEVWICETLLSGLNMVR